MGVSYDTYKTMEGTRTRHGRVHMFITHLPTLTLQLHNFDLFRTCRTSCFCSVAWQLGRFQLTRRIALSLGDSWASRFTSRGIAWPVYLLPNLCRVAARDVTWCSDRAALLTVCTVQCGWNVNFISANVRWRVPSSFAGFHWCFTGVHDSSVFNQSSVEYRQYR